MTVKNQLFALSRTHSDLFLTSALARALSLLSPTIPSSDPLTRRTGTEDAQREMGTPAGMRGSGAVGSGVEEEEGQDLLLSTPTLRANQATRATSQATWLEMK